MKKDVDELYEALKRFRMNGSFYIGHGPAVCWEKTDGTTAHQYYGLHLDGASTVTEAVAALHSRRR